MFVGLRHAIVSENPILLPLRSGYGVALERAWDAMKNRHQLALRPLKKRDTPIAITHHDTAVSYRNIRVQQLP